MYPARPQSALRPIAALLVSALLSPAAFAQTTLDQAIVLTEVQVVGDQEAITNKISSAQVIDQQALEDSQTVTINEALRRVPGVNVRDEEGFGMRPNIGIRGLNPTRSTKVTLLEDGLPLAYAPYGDNASYFHPLIDRYDRIEVLKGASSMLYGPQTIGGVVNYITPAPSQEWGGKVKLGAGNQNYRNAHAQVSGNGLLIDYGYKQGDGSRDNMNHKVNDLNLKYVTAIGDTQALTLRANYFTEDSQLTYSGLTQAEFDKLGRSYNPFKNDHFDTSRLGLSATHHWQINAAAALQTSVYYSQFDRDWWRQASNSQDGQCGAAFNARRLAGQTVNADSCNSSQGRLRNYETYGIEPRLTVNHAWGELQAGVKAHFEEQNRKQINTKSATGRTGTTAEDNLRTTDAYSAYLANRFSFGNLAITPLLRYESIAATREDRLNKKSGQDDLTEVAPGIGLTWEAMPNLTVFSSLYEGFAPPRVEDLIGSNGTSTEVDAEKSHNFELGLRTQLWQSVNVQAAYFRNDFSNLIAVGSIAGGGTPLSQGEALFSGFELAADAQHQSGLNGRVAYTWLPVADQSTAFRNVATGAKVGVEGKRQPYAPEHTLTAAVGYKAKGFGVELEAQYVGSQYADFANTGAASRDGQRGKLADYTVWNMTVNYQVNKQASVYLTGKNLADSDHIVDRTRGIQVAMPRLIQAGVNYGF